MLNTTTDAAGRNELHVAAARGDARMARLLLERGVDPTVADDYGYTPFHYAAMSDAYEVVATLLEFGGYTNQPPNRTMFLKVKEGEISRMEKHFTEFHS